MSSSIDKSKCPLDKIIKKRYMFLLSEFNDIVSEFESSSNTFLKRAAKFHVRLCSDKIWKSVVKNSVSKQRLESVPEYDTRVKEMIFLRRLHELRTAMELDILDSHVNQLDAVMIDGLRTRIVEASARRWRVTVEEQRLRRSHLQDPPKDDTSSSSSSSSSVADENDFGFDDEVDQELTLVDGASFFADLAGIIQDLRQLNDLLKQYAPPEEELAQESSSSLPDGDSRSALDTLTLIKRELQQLNDTLRQQALPQEVAQEYSKSESVDGGYDGVANTRNSVLQRLGDKELMVFLGPTNELDAVANNRGLQQSEGQYGVAQELSPVGGVDDQNAVAQESSSVARVDDQNEVAREPSDVSIVDDNLVNNPGLQPVNVQEDAPPEEDVAEIWRREVGVVGTHGDGSRFSLGEQFMFIKPLKGQRRRR